MPATQASSKKSLSSRSLFAHFSSQVIGISDTGLDDASCFFRDSAKGPVPRGLWPQDVGVVYPEQRKVRVDLLVVQLAHV